MPATATIITGLVSAPCGCQGVVNENGTAVKTTKINGNTTLTGIVSVFITAPCAEGHPEHVSKHVIERFEPQRVTVIDPQAYYVRPSFDRSAILRALGHRELEPLGPVS